MAVYHRHFHWSEQDGPANFRTAQRRFLPFSELGKIAFLPSGDLTAARGSSGLIPRMSASLSPEMIEMLWKARLRASCDRQIADCASRMRAETHEKGLKFRDCRDSPRYDG